MRKLNLVLSNLKNLILKYTGCSGVYDLNKGNDSPDPVH